MQTADNIALAILTQELGCQDALRLWVMARLPGLLPGLLPLALFPVTLPTAELLNECIDCPSFQMANAALLAYIFDIPGAFWECTRFLYMCVRYDEDLEDLVNLKLLLYVPTGLLSKPIQYLGSVQCLLTDFLP